MLSDPQGSGKGGKRHVAALKEALGLETFSKKREKKIQKRKKKKAEARALQQSLMIPTLATRGSTGVHQPEIVTFVSHKKKKKAEKQEPVVLSHHNSPCKKLYNKGPPPLPGLAY
jgi:hypothetical protein